MATVGRRDGLVAVNKKHACESTHSRELLALPVAYALYMLAQEAREQPERSGFASLKLSHNTGGKEVAVPRYL